MSVTLNVPAGVMDASYASARQEKPHLQFRLRTRAAVVAQSIRRFLGKRRVRLLEIGAADGRTLVELAGTVAYRELVGVEYSAGLRESAPSLPRGVRLIAGDAADLPPELAPGSFDVASLLAVLEHLSDPAAALREAYRILRPGGILVATCPDPIWDKWAARAGLENTNHHVTPLDLSELIKRFHSAGFEVLEARRFMWAPVAILPYLGLHISPSLALDLDRIISRISILRRLCVNAYVVGRRPNNPALSNDHAQNRRTARLFDQAAQTYDAVSNPYTVRRRAAALAEFARGRCLELGGGTGAVTRELRDRGPVVHSDISIPMCREARRKLGCPSLCLDAEAIPFADASVDSTVSAEMIYYLQNPQRCIAEAHRVLHPGGRLVLSTTNAAMTVLERGRSLLRKLGFSRMFFDDGSPSFIPLRRLREMLTAAGFTIEQTQGIVILPFAACDRLNHFLERTFLARLGLFIVIVAKKTE